MGSNKHYFLVNSSGLFYSRNEMVNIDHLVHSAGKILFCMNGTENNQMIKNWFNEPCGKTILEISDNPDYLYDNRLPEYKGTAFLVEPTEDGFGTGTKGFAFSVKNLYYQDVVVYHNSDNSMHFEDAEDDIKDILSA